MTIAANLMIAGEAGQGVQSAGFILSRALARGGYHIFADQDYESRVRGGHNFFRIRASDIEIGAVTEKINVLLALNEESITRHEAELVKDGVIICDEAKLKDKHGGNNLLPIPMAALAEEMAGIRIMENTVGLGACLGLTGYDLEKLERVLQERFGEKAGAANTEAARAGYEYARQHFPHDFSVKLKTLKSPPRRLLNGNEALSLGALAAGCKFVAAYPMTPASSILEYLAAQAEEMGLAVVQPEDEIAAINMAIGAGYAGVRSLTATSGSGFCLMVEGLGLAGLTETPIVIVDAQRPGPAVGLPTRTEQGDLEFVISAHHGTVERAVLAPATVADAFWLTVKAFNLSERYQLPVIILTDHYLATAYATVDNFDLSKITIDRGEVYSGESAAYQRHAVTSSGISPRALPELSEALVITDADEHDAAGHLTESAEERNEQVAKRQRKMAAMSADISPPELYGPPQAELTLVGWGSTYGALRETVDTLKGKLKLNLLHFQELWPFPAPAVEEVLSNTQQLCVVESNATGQLARLIRAETGREIPWQIMRYDGRPLTPASIIAALKKGER